jgi:CRISPR system Cascade subunit CasE
MSADRPAPVLVRARLRRDVPARALAGVLLPREPGARVAATHSVVWALFADAAERRRDFLWRETRPGEFLILAARAPTDPHGLFALEYKAFAPALRPGQRLGFDLRANPVVSIPKITGERGRRHDVVMHALLSLPAAERAAARARKISEAGAAWLSRKGTAAGFSFAPSEVLVDAYERVRIPRHASRAVTFSTLTFQGRLTVHDPPRFIANVLHGFGAAKSYGCGLMLIRRAL